MRARTAIERFGTPELPPAANVAGHPVDPHAQVRRLQRFLSPQVARFILSCSEDELLEARQREITVAFGDLRGFTPFAQTADPRRMLEILRSYHEVLGPIITQFAGTVERFTGDGIMVYFDDSPVADQVVRAVEMAVQMREAMTGLCHGWRRSGYELDYSMGVALGFAIVGVVGFPGRYDYAAIGPVTNLSSRLCARALPGQILISQGVYDIVSPLVNVERVTGLTLAGFDSPVTAYNVRGLREAAD